MTSEDVCFWPGRATPRNLPLRDNSKGYSVFFCCISLIATSWNARTPCLPFPIFTSAALIVNLTCKVDPEIDLFLSLPLFAMAWLRLAWGRLHGQSYCRSWGERTNSFWTFCGAHKTLSHQHWQLSWVLLWFKSQVKIHQGVRPISWTFLASRKYWKLWGSP